MECLRRFLGVTKSTGLKFVKPSISSHFLESIDPSYVNSAMSKISQERMAN